MALCEEDIEIVGIVFREPKISQIDGSRYSTMDAFEVKCQFIVDKHPNVIITVE